MRVPNRELGGFANEVIKRCTASRPKRLSTGAVYRNLFLTGSPDGIPQTYNKTNIYIERLASQLYSPVDMRFGMDSDGPVSATERAMGVRGIGELHKRIRRGDVDRKVSEAVKWSLIKGKVMLKLRWAGSGFDADVVQPEVMGVEREDLGSLDAQQAFIHSTWYTTDSFVNLVWDMTDRDALLSKARNLAKASGDLDASRLKNVMMGGGWNGVYQAADSTNPQGQKGMIPDWLQAPAPNLAPELATRLLQVDELWVMDDEREDWTVLTMLAGAGDDAIIHGRYQRCNLFADAMPPVWEKPDKKTGKDRFWPKDKDNPLACRHPFIEFCPNTLDGYFWGESEILRCALLQQSINSRIDGINQILRRQEKPSRAFIGMAGATPNTIARLNKPGGWMTEPSPNGKIQNMQPDLPPGLFQSLHEIIGLFDDMGGVTPTLGGEGEAGVRSGNHAQTLLRSSTPHIKDRAIDIERSVSEVGNLGLLLMKAMMPEMLTAWVRGKEAGIEAEAAKAGNVEEPPVRDLVPVQFLMRDIPDELYATIDGHSSSPVFAHEHEQQMFQLARLGAVSPQKLVESLHPPHEAELVFDLERRAVDQAEMIREHPEILTHKQPKKPVV